MAGEMKIKGWIGSSTTYKEVRTPTISYTPIDSGAGIYNKMNKQLSRTIMCFSKYLDTVLQTLETYNASISVNIIDDVSGTIASKNYGSGWQLKVISTSEDKRPFTTVNLRYEKEVTTIFEFNLPTGITITNALGVCTIAYEGDTIETIDSGKGETISGLTVEIIGGITLVRGASAWLSPDYEGPYDIPYNLNYVNNYIIDITLNLMLDGVIIETLKINTNDYEDLFEVYEYRVRYSDGIFYYVRTDPILRNGGLINQTLRWDTSETNHIKLIFWDKVLRDWTVT